MRESGKLEPNVDRVQLLRKTAAIFIGRHLENGWKEMFLEIIMKIWDQYISFNYK